MKVLALVFAIVFGFPFDLSATSISAAPQYPKEALDKCIEGWVLLKYTITKEGRVKGAKVVDASPRGYFEESALSAINLFQFEPKLVGGLPVEVVGETKKMHFQIDKTSSDHCGST
ncbi:energy transducer TonB [Microbulbifer thermotolerans]|uniref:energy transducer TonB n=1 Tax=Microbulbifer thermotolerans TaxID=252514 RepID=UPI00224A52DD|nr:energy transducer TonB [Microbulbifer thermotolerans]MCX2842305.1 energy transducer TonB [Microbulbifer thermotolerans]